MHGKLRHKAVGVVMGCWDVQHTVYVLRVPKDVFQIEDAEKVLSIILHPLSSIPLSLEWIIGIVMTTTNT